MSDTGGIAQKLAEMGVSAAKATAQEVKTTVSEAASQLTGDGARSDDDLKQIAANDEAYKSKRMGEIQQELGGMDKKKLAQQKMRQFQEVSSWGTTPTTTPRQEAKGPEIPNARTTTLPSSQQTSTIPATKPLEPLRQAMGKSEQGRNFKG